MYIFKTIIIPINYQGLANSLAEGLAGSSGINMFDVTLCDMNNIVTHCVATGMIYSEFNLILTDAVMLYNRVSQYNITQQQCDDLINSSDVSSDEPFCAFSRLGLTLYEGEL